MVMTEAKIRTKKYIRLIRFKRYKLISDKLDLHLTNSGSNMFHCTSYLDATSFNAIWRS